MFYTRKGDAGKTKLFNTKFNESILKSSAIIEALGSVDELNSFLGLCKVKSEKVRFKNIDKHSISTFLNTLQDNLFTVQAELAGSDKFITEYKVMEMEKIIDRIEKNLPPIKTFFVSGGTELGALFDIARTLARRAERRVIEATEKEKLIMNENTMKYLNRFSSVLYALARFVNYKSGVVEQPPHYN